MSKRTTLVTGAATGIGAAIATELVGRDHVVVVTDVDEVAGSAHAASIGAPFHRLDVTDDSMVASVAATVAAAHGPLTGWVNNAGISAMERFVDVAPAQLDRTLAVNLRAVFVGGQVAARAMISSGGGRIVNVASMAGKQGRVPFLADYVASKFGVVGLTQAMAYELAEHGIRVNCVCPGYVATSMQRREIAWESKLRGISPKELEQAWIADTPLGRLEQPTDVGRAVAFLLSDDAEFITGEALSVNGGAYMDWPAMSARDSECEIAGLFDDRQREQLRPLVTPAVVAEHAARPIGDPSPALAVLLAAMRQSPTVGKLALLETVVDQEWAIVRLSGTPGVPHRIEATERYRSHEAALHAVFLRRLDEMGLGQGAPS